jgi:hypothetical protein
MKKVISLALVIFPALSPFAQGNLTGAYKIVHARYGYDTASWSQYKNTKIIKIFKDGYWIGAFFGAPNRPFDGCGGGTYKTDGNEYVETLNFYSWDKTAAGKTFSFEYTLAGNTYTQRGKINSDKYKDYPIEEVFERIDSYESLKNDALEGVWQLENGQWPGLETDKSKYKNLKAVKIYCYPRFAWAQYDSTTSEFLGAGGGTYQFDGNNLIENIEYITYDVPLNTAYALKIEMAGNGKFLQTDMNNSKENWKRLQ